MTEITTEFIEKILETIGPYVCDRDSIKDFLEERLGRDVQELILELDQRCQNGSDERWNTDNRILINALKRL